MYWTSTKPIVGGGQKASLINDRGETVATVVSLPGTVTRGYVYAISGFQTTVDEPDFDVAKARVSDIVGLTTGAYREARENAAAAA